MKHTVPTVCCEEMEVVWDHKSRCLHYLTTTIANENLSNVVSFTHVTFSHVSQLSHSHTKIQMFSFFFFFNRNVEILHIIILFITDLHLPKG